MKKYRIISDGESFLVQKRVCLIFWETEQRAEINEKDTGGPKFFKTKKEAEKYIADLTPKKWEVV